MLIALFQVSVPSEAILPIVLLQLAMTLYLCGLIAAVQAIIYPAFGRMHPSTFVSVHALHMRRIAFVVGPPMVGEAVIAVVLVFVESTLPPVLTWTSLALVAVIWGSTVLVQVPIHGELQQGFDGNLIARLVRTNWIRTVCWFGRLAVGGMMVYGFMG